MKEKRIEYFKERDEKIKSFSAIEDIMAIHQNNREKGEVF